MRLRGFWEILGLGNDLRQKSNKDLGPASLHVSVSDRHSPLAHLYYSMVRERK